MGNYCTKIDGLWKVNDFWDTSIAFGGSHARKQGKHNAKSTSTFRGEFSKKKGMLFAGDQWTQSGWPYSCRRVTKVAHAPCEVKKSMLPAGDQWTFAVWMAIFMQTCDKSWKIFKKLEKREISKTKVCFSLGTSEHLQFTSQGVTVTFVIRLH